MTRAFFFRMSGLGEMSVGLGVLVLPDLLGFLAQTPLDRGGSLVARMFGVAVFAIGLTWWRARNEPSAGAVCTLGFLAYNIGVGALFGVAAVASVRPFVPSLVAVLHLLIAGAFGATFVLPGDSARSREATVRSGESAQARTSSR